MGNGKRNMAIPRTILFDFDGVLCHDRFYGETVKSQYPEVHDWIQENIFGSNDKLVKDWMRGKIRAQEINQIVVKYTGIDYAELHKLFVESVRNMKIDERIIGVARELKQNGRTLGIVTDNMDVFTEITVSNHKLDELFGAIVNSADHGYLKKDENGKLFDIAMAAVGENDISNTLLIDDSASTIELYRERGGNAYRYKNFTEFQAESPWDGEQEQEMQWKIK